MTFDRITKAFNKWLDEPGSGVTALSIFEAGYKAGAAQLEALSSRVKALEHENAWLESHGKSWGVQTIDAATASEAPRLKWEAFCDEAYFSLWAVRPLGEQRFGHCFHMQSMVEAEALRDLLNAAA